jgi:DNA-binding SARP family transcriptional activator
MSSRFTCAYCCLTGPRSAIQPGCSAASGGCMDDRERGSRDSCPRVQLRLLGGFGLSVEGLQIALPLSTQRVLVALALRPREQDRTALGEMLYPDGRRTQASASVRSALWRAKREASYALVDSRGQRLRLAEDVEVDLQTWMHHARTLTSQSRIEPAVHCSELVETLSQELLPSWRNEEWLVLERQWWDLLRLHALEQLAERFAAAGRHVDALEAGLAAVAIEPYRESAHRAVIRAHIAEGNSASALAQYHRCQRLLTRELGVRPTAQLQALVQGLTGE